MLVCHCNQQIIWWKRLHSKHPLDSRLRIPLALNYAAVGIASAHVTVTENSPEFKKQMSTWTESEQFAYTTLKSEMGGVEIEPRTKLPSDTYFVTKNPEATGKAIYRVLKKKISFQIIPFRST